MILLTMDDFIRYVEQKMSERHWSQADLAREANMTTSMVSNLLSGRRKVGIGTANSLSKALRIPVIEILSVAGLIPKVPKSTAEEEQLLYLFRQMTPDQRRDVLEYADFKLNR